MLDQTVQASPYEVWPLITAVVQEAMKALRGLEEKDFEDSEHNRRSQTESRSSHDDDHDHDDADDDGHLPDDAADDDADNDADDGDGHEDKDDCHHDDGVVNIVLNPRLVDFLVSKPGSSIIEMVSIFTSLFCQRQSPTAALQARTTMEATGSLQAKRGGAFREGSDVSQDKQRTV